eukprot:sb/3471270/
MSSFLDLLVIKFARITSSWLLSSETSSGAGITWEREVVVTERIKTAEVFGVPFDVFASPYFSWDSFLLRGGSEKKSETEIKTSDTTYLPLKLVWGPILFGTPIGTVRELLILYCSKATERFWNHVSFWSLLTHFIVYIPGQCCCHVTGNQPIRTRYLGHVTGYRPIRGHQTHIFIILRTIILHSTFL